MLGHLRTSVIAADANRPECAVRLPSTQTSVIDGAGWRHGHFSFCSWTLVCAVRNLGHPVANTPFFVNV